MRYYVDPHQITNYNRSVEELQAFWLFAILAAGKKAVIQAQKLAEFLQPIENEDIRPFEYLMGLTHLNALDDAIREHKLGQYNRVSRCFTESMRLDMEKVDVYDLERIYGVGPKTARFFLLHSREDEELAVLDTHILRWMREELGVNAPKTTPTGDKYAELEEIFLEHANSLNISPADLDLSIWKRYTK
jgi:thermostable 8-oxoguanine DNA glycosylase